MGIIEKLTIPFLFSATTTIDFPNGLDPLYFQNQFFISSIPGVCLAKNPI